MENKVDRRIRYTKALLKEALISLLQEKHISKITITAICAKADVHRSTFYAHYTDPLDLLRQMQREIMEGIFERDNREGNDTYDHKRNREVMLEILKYNRENGRLIMALMGENTDDSFIRTAMTHFDLHSLSPDIRVSGREREYMKLFVVNGILHVIQKWLQNGALESDEAIADLILQMVGYGITSFKS